MCFFFFPLSLLPRTSTRKKYDHLFFLGAFTLWFHFECVVFVWVGCCVQFSAVRGIICMPKTKQTQKELEWGRISKSQYSQNPRKIKPTKSDDHTMQWSNEWNSQSRLMDIRAWIASIFWNIQMCVGIVKIVKFNLHLVRTHTHTKWTKKMRNKC